MADLLERLQQALASRYRIERELGRGGMATVYLAEDLKHHRPVALKVLNPELAAVLGPERFLREIELAARLTHPHILPLHDSGNAEGFLYYVMPYVEGESLRGRLAREKQLALDEALQFAREVADALSYAHARGVVHRDIKPENILLESGHAVVGDFGIARAIDQAGGGKLTGTGIAVGTPAFMSPEQAAGSRDVDGRSDQYSLGCVLYEMLAGVPPFAGTTAESLAHQHMNVAPRPVTELRPAVPGWVAVAVQRALAKTPADRFPTTADFATALVASAAPAGTLSPTPMVAPAVAPPRPRRWVLPAVGVLVAGIIALAAWREWGPFGGGHGRPAKKDWILVAEFDGPPDDSTLAAAARSLVSAALDQSELVATVPPDQIQLALQQAGKPANTRVSAAVARELAYRRAVRVVLEGDIARIGQGYSVVLRVVDAESLRVVVTERGSARNEDALIPALGNLAEKLRRDLGERRGAIAATRELREVATPSFEAYRLCVQAIQGMQSGDYPAAVALCREALRLDPDFATAWSTMGTSYVNLGRADSALAALDQAIRRPERSTRRQQLMRDGQRAGLEGDVERALAAYTHLIQSDPEYGAAYNQLGITLGRIGRFQDELAQLQEAERRMPFGTSNIPLNNQVEVLLSLGRVDQARDLARRVRGLLGPDRVTEVELAAHHWATAESMATAQAEDPRAPSFRRVVARHRLAQAQAGRGSLRAAEATLFRSVQVTLGTSFIYQVSAGRALLHLAIETDRATAVPSDAWVTDSSAASLLFRGLRSALTGDEAAARRLLNAARKRPAYEIAQEGASPVLLEARVAALGGRWDEIVRILQPVAAQSAEIGTAGSSRYPAGLPAVRCLLADAYERMGAPDSAAAYLERMTTDPAAWRYWSGIAQPLARRRLILLYAHMGRVADAERHLAILERWWDRPDDIARRMLDEARAAVRSARGMARPERART